VGFFDETLSPYIVSSNGTYAPINASKVPSQGAADKRGYTTTLGVTLAGEMTPFFSIHSGLTSRSIPAINYPKGFYNTYSGGGAVYLNKKGQKKTKTTKWQNYKTILEYANKIWIPYFEFVRSQENSDHGSYLMKDNALLLCDQHYSHIFDDFIALMLKHKVEVKFVEITDEHCVIDLSECKPYKQVLKEGLVQYTASVTYSQLKRNTHPSNVKIDLTTSNLKPRVASWMVDAYEHMMKTAKTRIDKSWQQAIDNFSKTLNEEPFILPSFKGPEFMKKWVESLAVEPTFTFSQLRATQAIVDQNDDKNENGKNVSLKQNAKKGTKKVIEPKNKKKVNERKSKKSVADSSSDSDEDEFLLDSVLFEPRGHDRTKYPESEWPGKRIAILWHGYNCTNEAVDEMEENTNEDEECWKLAIICERELTGKKNKGRSKTNWLLWYNFQKKLQDSDLCHVEDLTKEKWKFIEPQDGAILSHVDICKLHDDCLCVNHKLSNKCRETDDCDCPNCSKLIKMVMENRVV